MVKSLPPDDGLKANALNEIGESTKSLTEKNLKLLLSQQQLSTQDKINILSIHGLTDEEARAKLETLGLTAATNANTAANTANAASANTLKGAFTGLAASAKATWAAMSMLQKASVIFAAISIAWSIGSSIFSSMKQREEEMVQAANDAKTAIKDIKSDFDNLSSKTDDIKQRFAELAQGVENLGKANQSRGKLSTEDYEEFLELSNQLAGLFPQLTTGYDDNGNAILNLSGNVNTIVGSLNDLVLVQQKLANQQILENMPDVWKGYASDLNEYNKELGVSKDQVDAYQTALNKMSSGDGRTLTTDSYFEQHAMINAARKTGLDDGKWYQNKLAEMSNEVYENGEFQYAEWDFSSLTDEQIEQLKNELGALGAEYEKSVQGLAIIKENPSLINEVTTSVADKWGMELSGDMESVVGNINTVDSTLNGIRTDLQEYFASTQQDKKDTSDTSSDRFMSGDISSIRDSLSDLADHSSRRGNSDTGLEGKELNVMEGTNWKPLNSTNGNASGGNSTDKLVSMGSSKIATKFNHDQSLGENKDDEVIHVDLGDGRIRNLVKVEPPEEFVKLGERLMESPINYPTPNLDNLAKQLAESAPTRVENNSTHIENVNFSLPNVENYEDFCKKAQKDKNFEIMINHMVRTQFTGSNRLEKFKVMF